MPAATALADAGHAGAVGRSDRRRDQGLAGHRPTVEFGTLVVEQAQGEADGPCRDYNFDPTIPSGMALSDDPLLPARSAAYAYSFDLRTAEANADPPAGPAGAAR